MFTGTVQSQLSCSVCGKTSTTNESFIDLSLTVDRHNEDDGNIGRDSPMDVVDSIEHFTAAETLHEKVVCSSVFLLDLDFANFFLCFEYRDAKHVE
jgi:ubiquitin C-terminal hydrolase